jgi:hypothetical protein
VKLVYRIDLRKTLDLADARRRRSRQKLPGASEIGQCRRRTAYRLVGQPVDNPTSKAKAIEGTIKHKVLLPLLRQEHGGQIEVRLLDEERHLESALDHIRQNPLGMWIVSDLKTYGRDVYEHRVQQPVRTHVLYQLHLYGDMVRRGKIHPKEKRFPHEPLNIEILELVERCRDDGRSNTRILPYDQAIADEAWAWYADVRERVATDGTAAYVPRDLPGPDKDAVCRGCPFAGACWGWNPQEETRQPLDLNQTELLEHLQEYKRWQEVEADAKKRKERARAHLDGQPEQTVDGWKLKWNGGRETYEEVFDEDTAREKFDAAGIPIPMKSVTKKTRVNISVSRPARKKE